MKSDGYLVVVVSDAADSESIAAVSAEAKDILASRNSLVSALHCTEKVKGQLPHVVGLQMTTLLEILQYSICFESCYVISL